MSSRAILIRKRFSKTKDKYLYDTLNIDVFNRVGYRLKGGFANMEAAIRHATKKYPELGLCFEFKNKER